MAYKIVNDDSLTSVANAIRVQGSISGTLEFPDGFVSAIQNLSPSSNDFVITLSWDTQDEMWTIDKTYAEAYAAYQAGKTLTTTVDATDFSDGIVVGSRVWFDNDANQFWFYIIWGSDTEKFGGGKHQLYGLSSLDGYYYAETHDALLYPQFESPSRTYTPTTSTQTETITYDASDDYNGIEEVGITVNPIPSNYKDTTDATATADKILQGYTAYAGGEKLVGTASGGITPSGTIQITQNGQVDVTQYATADVNVSGGGGASNVVTGSCFVEEVATSEGAIHTITTNYNGNGYIIGFAIICSSSSSMDIAGINCYSALYFVKPYTTIPATYLGSGNVNKGLVFMAKKSSSSLGVTGANYDAYCPSTTSPSGASLNGVVCINDKKTIKVRVQGTNTNYFGIKSGETYQYYVLYSE